MHNLGSVDFSFKYLHSKNNSLFYYLQIYMGLCFSLLIQVAFDMKLNQSPEIPFDCFAEIFLNRIGIKL